MRNWIDLFENASPLEKWRDNMLANNIDLSDEDARETGIGDLCEMAFDEAGNLFIHRQICFLDADQWLADLKSGNHLGLYWTFDAHMATAYNSTTDHRDCVTIVAKLAPEHHNEAEVILEHHEAEVRLTLGTELTVVSLYRNGGRGGDLRSDLYGAVFLT